MRWITGISIAVAFALLGYCASIATYHGTTTPSLGRQGPSDSAATHRPAPKLSDTTVGATATATPKTESEGADLRLKLTDLFQARDYLQFEDTLREAARRYPTEVLDWCRNLPPSARSFALEITLSIWMQSDDRAAFAWAKNHDRDFFRSEAFLKACVSTGNLKLALDGLNLVAPGERQSLIRDAGEMFAIEQPDLVSSIAATLSWNDALMLTSGMLRALAAKSPDAALAKAVGDSDSARVSKLVTDVIGSIIEKHGPEEAAELLSKLTPSKDYDRAYITLASALAASTPDLVFPWVETVIKTSENEVIADNRLVPLLVAIGDSNPQLRAQVAAYTSDPNLLVRRLSTPLQQWSLRDPAAATNFVATLSNVSPEVRQKLMNFIHH